MPKRPGLSCQGPQASCSTSFSLSDTGSFAKESFVVGSHGITQSPNGHLGEVSTLRLEDVELGPLIGRGASSRVYIATHRPLQQRLALKVLQADIEVSRESRHMVLNEIKVIFNASSDHLVAFYDAFFHDGCIHLALEYMDCGSLESVMRAVAQTQARVMPVGMLSSILFQSLQGLIYLHRERRTCHRDLKPANVLLSGSGFVKLSDFGIAKELGSGTYAQAGTQCGTLAYMAPERVRGGAYGFASDVWSLGLIALEAAIGTYPYPGAMNHFALVQMIVEGPLPTARPEVEQLLTPQQKAFVDGCLTKEAAARPDVISLTRAPFFADHLQRPVDLAALLAELRPLLEQQQQPQSGV